MIKTPAEFDPYQTMVDLLLLEAQEMHADQILLISRSENASLYFVSESRVMKRIQLQTDLTPDFLDHLSRTQMALSHSGQTSSIHIKLARSRLGHCFSLTIRKLRTREPADVDRTIPITPHQLEQIVTMPARPALVFKVR